ncbi:protein-methionine-sulfoxide reductase heme-binding subunit MsrQ [Rhizobium paknamense]|uniref:Protein-methionine-sulfoxide reductase heme-binding subunit MsrQ n=1 Tax=Rhizobium paknamense TaxID=1206817 RepID=A0ABU0I6Q4_9HYPH|nr:protein-methionine-sulfoxide reductase heme-binding subunit MsrQ [Rhizobium paknamense]MDQ0453904.1 sulfoxide reductase heme-binding subunit YedZ [Rhizobium paknamense]
MAAYAPPARYREPSIWALYILGLLPGIYAFYLGLTDQLGADPVRTFEHSLGIWALRFLCLGLLITPLRDLARLNLIAYRRALGLLAFYYVLAHFTIYLTLDRGMILASIASDIFKRPYIMLGMLGLLLLIPLALTSNRWSMRKLGPRWITLHKAVYIILPAGLLHFVLSRKSFTLEPAFYTGIVILLLGYRMIRPALMRRKADKRKFVQPQQSH